MQATMLRHRCRALVPGFAEETGSLSEGSVLAWEWGPGKTGSGKGSRGARNGLVAGERKSGSLRQQPRRVPVAIFRVK